MNNENFFGKLLHMICDGKNFKRNYMKAKFQSYFSANCTMVFTHFKFTRPLGNHFLQTFIPSIMLSYASAASVFIPPKAVPGRMGLCVTTLLSLITLFNGAR